MSPIKKNDLVPVPGMDPAESFRQGMKLFTTADKLRVFITFTKNPPSTSAIEDFVRASGVSAPLDLAKFTELESMLNILDSKTPIVIADIREQVLPIPDVEFVNPKDSLEKFWLERQLSDGDTKVVFDQPYLAAKTIVAKRKSAAPSPEELEFVDVLGESDSGEWRATHISIGEGLKESEKGEIVTTRDGYLTFFDEKLALRENLLLESEADTDGQLVSFAGSVTVGAKLPVTFDIDAGADIMIHSQLNAASLKSGRSITIEGDIEGSPHTLIQAKGPITAEFLNQAQVISSKDIHFDVGAYYSKVRAFGKLLVPNGPIVGGDYYGAFGVLAAEIGDEEGTSTHVYAGYNLRIPNSLGAYIYEEQYLQGKMVEVQNTVQPFLKDPERQQNLTDDDRATLLKLREQLTQLKDRYMHVHQKADSLMDRRFYDAKITVSGVVYPGVTVFINNIKHEVNEKLSNVEFSFDIENHEIRVNQNG